MKVREVQYQHRRIKRREDGMNDAKEIKEKLSIARGEAIREAAGNLSHMINSSLFSIILKSELLFRNNKHLDRETTRALFTIKEEAEKIHKAMKGLLHLYNLKQSTFKDSH